LVRKIQFIMNRRNTTFFALIFLTFNIFSQKATLGTADKLYDNYSYVDAIDMYKKVAAKGYKDETMFQKLGNAYYFNAELDKAVHWYSELFQMNLNQPKEYYFRYAQSLKSIGDYSNADKMIELYNNKSKDDFRGILYESSKDYLKTIASNSGRFVIEDAGINSEFSDYGTSFFGNYLVFASGREVLSNSKTISRWNNQRFTNLYKARVTSSGKIEAPEKFSKEVNSKFHESTPVFTNDGQTMYFTRNNFNEGKRGQDDKHVTLLKLYKASLINNEWKNVVELPFNSDLYSVAHPALSPDDKVLYFASNMPGTIGQSDLYMVEILSDNSYSKPVNLGKGINTEGRETFPFISDDGYLYYASDGHPGLGGLDVFVSKLDMYQPTGEIQNVGAPINSTTDDFAFLIDSQSRTGFFTSNRAGGQGYDDIYKFTETKKLACEQLITGFIEDDESKERLANVKVSLYDETNHLVSGSTTDSNGDYSFEKVICGKNYHIRVEKPGYDSDEQSAITEIKSGATIVDLKIEKRIKKYNIGSDLAKLLNIPLIYFDLNKYDITEVGAFHLEKILTVMNETPTLKIAIKSHTDSRGSAKSNEILSDNRAEATMNWLIENGISPDRLTAKGYGENELVNECEDGVKCSEELHQLNRRSNFIITEI
jgi:outer membrane protein OmpA-like peptidoglycan-associated protein/tetratricopeptide (TPR) repeat protein